ncbi:MAG: J domain-containing protein [Brevundimonas sp.]|nr:MAG: J domain-containing protein [Brevundimonas sp.]
MALGDGSIWKTLGIEPTDDAGAIRRAYAKRLRAVHPEDDPAGFKRLRLAYENAVEQVKSSQVRLLNDDIQPFGADTTSPEPAPPFSGDMSPFAGTLTIDQMLDQLALDEQREPELERRRQALGSSLRPGYSDQQRAAALEQIFQSDAMRSPRLFAETELWIAALLRSGSQETEVLVEPSIAFFFWDGGPGRYQSPQGRQALVRRDAVAIRSAIAAPSHKLHRAYLALRRPDENSRLYHFLPFGRRRQIAQLLEMAARNRELERMLDPDAVVQWRRKLSGPNYGQILFLALAVVPLMIAKLATWNYPADYDGNPFLAIWITTFLGASLLTGAGLLIIGQMKNRAGASDGWIDNLGDAAP